MDGTLGSQNYSIKDRHRYIKVMGLLDIDSVETLDYPTSKPQQKKLKKAGLLQLINLIKKNLDEKKDPKRFPKFGFEIEGHLLQMPSTHEMANPDNWVHYT